MAAVWLFLGLLEDVVTGDPLVRADAAVYQLFQQLRTPLGDMIMVALTELGDSTTVVAVAGAVLLWLLWRRAWRTCAYWLGAVAMASLFNTLIKATVYRARPIDDLYSGWAALSFPSGHSTVNAAMYSFLAFLAARELGAARLAPVAAAAALVVSIALSRIYLGAHWFSDVAAGLAFGLAWSTLLMIAYVHHNPPRLPPWRLLLVAGAALVLAGGANIGLRNDADLARYAVRAAVRPVEFSGWQSSEWRGQPARRIDLVGRLKEPLTVQWAGGLPSLEQQLLAAGWRRPRPWSGGAALSFLASAPPIESLPVVPLLQDGLPPSLTLVHPMDDGSRLVLWLWASSITTAVPGGGAQPIWIGSVVAQRTETLLSLFTVPVVQSDANRPRQVLARAMPNVRLVSRGADSSGANWDGLTLLAWPAGGNP
jgi:undecaprenyl-diphosphatase